MEVAAAIRGVGKACPREGGDRLPRVTPAWALLRQRAPATIRSAGLGTATFGA